MFNCLILFLFFHYNFKEVPINLINPFIFLLYIYFIIYKQCSFLFLHQFLHKINYFILNLIILDMLKNIVDRFHTFMRMNHFHYILSYNILHFFFIAIYFLILLIMYLLLFPYFYRKVLMLIVLTVILFHFYVGLL